MATRKRRQKVSYHCGACGKTQAGKRRPRGWEIDPGERLLCGRCVSSLYETKAVTLPVRRPLDTDWPTLRREFRTASYAVRRVKNRAMRVILREEHVRGPDDEKLPPPPSVYLYPEARAEAPELAPRTVTAVLQGVEQTWRARRYEAVWQGKTSAPSWRAPQPVPQTRQMWSVTRGPEGPVVSVQLGRERRRLLLVVRKGYGRRMHRRIRALLDGSAIRSECTLLERECVREGRRVRELAVKLVARFPRPARRARRRSGTLYVVTGEDRLWLAQCAGDERPWRYHADWIREKCYAYHRALDRARADGEASSTRMRDRRLKHRHRVRTFVEQAAARLADYADRRGVAEVRYDDGDQRWIAVEFEWSRLREQLRGKLAERDITLVASGDESRKSATPLAEEEKRT